MRVADNLAPESRSRLMSRIRRQNTGPEVRVRSVLHRLGYRFRLHRRDLPGTPDIVMPGKHVVIFVHGCFWHGHKCRAGRQPKSRLSYWGPKIEANRLRDARKTRELKALGWKVVQVWECELKDVRKLERKLTKAIPAGPLVSG